MPDPPPSVLTGHDISQATAQLRAEHDQETSGLQRAVDNLTGVVGLPGFVMVLAVAISLWIVGNIAARLFGFQPIDPPPFIWLQASITVVALFVAALILTTQRRADQLASHRDQLMLELAILNDQKTSKIIELLEEGRRDNPMIADRVDKTALAMSTPSDAQSVLDAIKDEEVDRS
jgi:uncharacterized membrane protein